MNRPVAFSVYGDEIYVMDQGNYRVHVFDFAGSFIRKWGSVGSTDGKFGTTYDVTVYEDEVFVADYGNNRIQVFALNGTFLRKWGTFGTGNGQLKLPNRIAISNDEVYVSDLSNYRIQVFDLAGNYIRKWGSQGSGDGQFDTGAWGIAVYNDEVYVSDISAHRIQVFDTYGNFIRKWGSLGSGDGQLNRPTALAEHDGNIVVADSSNRRFQAFTPNGVFVLSFGSSGTGDGQFSNANFARGIGKEFYAADHGVNIARIQIFGIKIEQLRGYEDRFGVQHFAYEHEGKIWYRQMRDSVTFSDPVEVATGRLPDILRRPDGELIIGYEDDAHEVYTKSSRTDGVTWT